MQNDNNTYLTLLPAQSVHQYQSYYEYAQRKNNHVVDMASALTLSMVKTALNHKDGCLAQLKKCANNGSNDVCQDADNFCAEYVTAPLLGNRSTYYSESFCDCSL